MRILVEVRILVLQKQKSQKRRRNRLLYMFHKERLKTYQSQNVRGDEIESFVYYTLKRQIFNQSLKAEQIGRYDYKPK